MEQRPVFENSLISGVIVNENNYAAPDEDDDETRTENEPDAETGGELFIVLPPMQE